MGCSQLGKQKSRILKTESPSPLALFLVAQEESVNTKGAIQGLVVGRGDGKLKTK